MDEISLEISKQIVINKIEEIIKNVKLNKIIKFQLKFIISKILLI